jgi:hypothetical protein
MSKDFGGIQSLFEDAIAPVHSASDATNGADRGGIDLRDGSKQTGGGETGQHVNTMTLRDSDTNPMTAAKGIPGS